MQGICVQETANTFRLITGNNKLKGSEIRLSLLTVEVISKEGNVFMVELPIGNAVTIYGNHLMMKSAERSARKFKAKSSILL